MNGRKFKFGAIFLLAAVLLTGMERTRVPKSVFSFVKSYETVKHTNASRSIWETLMYSFALTKQRSLECKAL